MLKVLGKSIFVFSLLSINLLAFSQNLYLTTYHVDNGLSTDVIKSTHQDRFGFVWLATDEGLVRFDGRSSLVFNQELQSSFIKSFLTLRNGELWVLEDMGISRIVSSPDSSRFELILRGGTRPTDSTVHYPKGFYQDQKGRIWISENTRILCWENQKLSIYQFDPKDHSGDFLRSFSFCEDSYGRLWVMSFPGRLHYFDPEANRFELVNLTKALGNTTTIIEASKGKLWAGSLDGVFQIEVSQAAKILDFKQVFSVNGVSCMQKIGQKVYIGTWSLGLHEARLREQTWQIERMSNLPFSGINHIYHSASNDIWISTNEGLGLLQPTFFEGVSIRGYRSFIQYATASPEGEVYVANDGPLFKLKPQQNFYADESIYNPAGGYVMTFSINDQSIWMGTSAGLVVKKDKVSGQTTAKAVGNGKLIQHIEADKNDNVWLAQDDFAGVLNVSSTFEVKPYIYQKGIISQINVIKISPEGEIYCGGDTQKGMLYRYDASIDKFVNLSVNPGFELRAEFGINDLHFDSQRGGIWLASSQGLLFYKDGSLERMDFGPRYTQESVRAITTTQDGSVWAAISFGLIRFKDGEFVLFDEASGLPAKTINYRSLFVQNGNQLWAGTVKGIAMANTDSRFAVQTSIPLFLEMKINGKPVSYLIQNQIFPNNSFLEAQVIALSFPTNRVLYQYRIKELNPNWSVADKSFQITQHKLTSGSYTLEVRAQQQGGYRWSEPVSYSFKVKIAWYESIWFFILAIAAMLFLAWGWARVNTIRLKAANKRFEKIIKDRTAEIYAKNTELEAQKIELQQKNEKITDSIRYAQNIQEAIMPDPELMVRCFSEYFVLNRPKDIVSGDFYWVYQNEDKVFLAVGDCTGHGVPAAMMVIVGSILLKEIVIEKGIHDPVAILSWLNHEISTSFNSKSEDGMDMALCVIDKQNHQLNFAGAKSSIIVFQNDEMRILKGSKNYLGGVRKQEKRSFEVINLPLVYPCSIYAYSDGFQDQFGGEPKQKYTTTRFREFIQTIKNRPFKEQRKLLQEELYRWMQRYEQLDDILVVGVKIDNPRH
jgi:ligand-binding sensor domain-containing protein/serine phosphatase RsbU (regulator of sigma subunit)